MIPETQNYNMTQEITTSQQGVTVNYYIIHQKKTFLDVEELSQEIPYAKKSIYNMISNVFLLWVFEAAPDISLGDYRPISKIWKQTLETCKIRYRTPYQLRHTFACNARDAGFTDSWIQHMLGHSTLDMLVRIYGNRKHILDGNRHGFTKEYVAEAVKNSSK